MEQKSDLHLYYNEKKAELKELDSHIKTVKTYIILF